MGTGYRVRIVSSNPAQTSQASLPFRFEGPSLALTPGLAGAPVCQGQVVTVSFSLPTGGCAFPNDNTFTAQLSNATGGFGNPVSLGAVQSGAGNSLTIPASTPAGTGYRIRLVSSSPALASANSAAFRINACASRVSAEEATLTVAPNPVSGGEIRCRVAGVDSPRFALFTTGGRGLPLRSSTGDVPGAFVLRPVQSLPTGLYVLEATEGTTRLTQKMLVVE